MLCTTCERRYRCQKISVTVIEYAGPHQQPYQLWLADLFKCPGCGHEIIGALADSAFAQHHEGSFAKSLARHEANGAYALREFPKADQEVAS